MNTFVERFRVIVLAGKQKQTLYNAEARILDHARLDHMLDFIIRPAHSDTLKRLLI